MAAPAHSAVARKIVTQQRSRPPHTCLSSEGPPVWKVTNSAMGVSAHHSQLVLFKSPRTAYRILNPGMSSF
jgi:hypothetical protein